MRARSRAILRPTPVRPDLIREVLPLRHLHRRHRGVFDDDRCPPLLDTLETVGERRRRMERKRGEVVEATVVLIHALHLTITNTIIVRTVGAADHLFPKAEAPDTTTTTTTTTIMAGEGEEMIHLVLPSLDDRPDRFLRLLRLDLHHLYHHRQIVLVRHMIVDEILHLLVLVLYDVAHPSHPHVVVIGERIYEMKCIVSLLVLVGGRGVDIHPS